MTPIFADFDLGDALLVVLEIFFFVIWIWILITVLSTSSATTSCPAGRRPCGSSSSSSCRS